MATTVNPAIPDAVKPVNIKIDTSPLDKIADKQAKSSMLNYELYAKTEWDKLSKEAFNNNAADPLKLGLALKDIADNILPDDFPDELKDKLYASMRMDMPNLIRTANNNKIKQTDIENKRMAVQSAENIQDSFKNSYKNYLQYNITEGDEKNEYDRMLVESQIKELQNISKITDYEGKNIFSDTDREKLSTLYALKLDGAKQFFDGMLLSGNAESAKDYYTKHILQSEEFMEKSMMDRKTYDDFAKYAKNKLEQYGQDVKKAQFNRTVAETLALESDFSTDKFEELKNRGLINDNVLDLMKESITTFNNLKPAQSNNPLNMVIALDTVAGMGINDDSFEAIQENIAVGVNAIAEVNRFAEEYGLSDSDRNKIVRVVKRYQGNALFRNQVDSLSDIITEAKNVQSEDWTVGGTDLKQFTVMNDKKQRALSYVIDNLVDQLDLAYTQGASTEQLQEIYDKGVINITKVKYGEQILPQHFDALEQKRMKGEVPLFEFDGEILKWKGYDYKGGFIVEPSIK